MDLLNALNGVQIALIVIAGVLLVLLVCVLIIVPVGLWFRALISGAHVPMSRLAGMRLRKMPVAEIVSEYIRATKAGINFDIDQMENHKMAGGDLTNIVNALIAANSSRISLTLEDARAIDLAGRDVWDAIRKSVDPYIIDIKDVSAIAKDGIEIKSHSRYDDHARHYHTQTEETDEKESHAEPAGSTCLHCFNICVCCPGRKRMGRG